MVEGCHLDGDDVGPQPLHKGPVDLYDLISGVHPAVTAEDFFAGELVGSLLECPGVDRCEPTGRSPRQDRRASQASSSFEANSDQRVVRTVG